jgi:hypothetical protein
MYRNITSTILDGITDCNDLSSTQEEADTRIVLYALNADRLYRENKVKGRIVVKSPDTDVLVLQCNHKEILSMTVYFHLSSEFFFILE